MIVVAGMPIPAHVPGLAGLGGTERHVFDAKYRSPQVYSYPAMEDLQFELAARSRIADAAVALERGGADFENFKDSYANSRYWDRTGQGGFMLKRGVAPADAINDIFYNGRLYGFECAMAVIIVLYKGILDVIGAGPFNRLFGGLYLYSWEHDSDLRLITRENVPETFIGDVLYARNPDFDPKTPEWQGENLIKLGDDRYFGHGIGIGSAQYFIQSLNNNRRPGSNRSAYLMDQATYPDYPAVRRLAFPQSGMQPIPFYFGRSPDETVIRIGSRIRVIGAS